MIDYSHIIYALSVMILVTLIVVHARSLVVHIDNDSVDIHFKKLMKEDKDTSKAGNPLYGTHPGRWEPQCTRAGAILRSLRPPP